MILKYLIYSFSITFCSFIIGMIITALIKNTKIYNHELSNLNFIKSEKLNSILGVSLIRWIVKNTFFKFLNPTLKFDRKSNITEIQNIRKLMTKAEIDHLIAFCFVFILIIILALKAQFTFALILLIFNILMNLCPSLLQQQNKRRIDNIISRFKKI